MTTKTIALIEPGVTYRLPKDFTARELNILCRTVKAHPEIKLAWDDWTEAGRTFGAAEFWTWFRRCLNEKINAKDHAYQSLTSDQERELYNLARKVNAWKDAEGRLHRFYVRLTDIPPEYRARLQHRVSEEE